MAYFTDKETQIIYETFETVIISDLADYLWEEISRYLENKNNMNSVDTIEEAISEVKAIEESGFTRFFSGDFNSEKVELIGKTLSAYVRSILSRDEIIQELIEGLEIFYQDGPTSFKNRIFHCLDKEFAVDAAEGGFREYFMSYNG
ncbi:hypothetical protein RZO27_03770 [Lactococcus lactis]|uniref:Uncharacterized protein n=1 Tax=Lactococcus lactis TaxID=1358 RepID=A0ABD5GQE1_9LACT|nr:hypothetical protein [Lactococcus lactis]MDV2618249.1 hypothetical protein [Lactococcus lactis]